MFSSCAVRAAANARTFAHELGHACRWPDISLRPGEQKARGTEQVPNFILPVRDEWLRDDWNNGTGDRFYPKRLYHSDIVDRLLMRGRGSEVKADIPFGPVQGLSSHGDASDIAVGIKYIMTTSPRSY